MPRFKVKINLTEVFFLKLCNLAKISKDHFAVDKKLKDNRLIRRILARVK